MDFTILLSALVGATLAGVVVSLISRNARATLDERLKSRDADNNRLQMELSEAQRTGVEGTAKAARLEAELAGEKAGSQARIDELHSSHVRLKAEFAELSAAALRASREDFLKQAEQTFTQIQAKSAGELLLRQQSIDALVKPLKESLDKVDTKIADLEKTRASAYGQLGQQLETLQKDQKSLQDQTMKLTNVLSTTRTAGTWGEVQLRRVVELSGFVEHVDFKEQVTANSESGRADLVVYLPRGQQIVVDAKAPTDAFRSAAAATDPIERARFLADHAGKVRKHVGDLGDRAYWANYTPSPEFVVLFLPGDQFLSAALEADPNIMDFAIDRKVLLATPTTLIALLKAAAYGWRQEAISKNAEESSAVGRELYDRIAVFADHLSGVSKGLEAATRSFNRAAGSFEEKLLPGARKFAELGAKGTKELEEPATTETAAREINKRS